MQASSGSAPRAPAPALARRSPRFAAAVLPAGSESAKFGEVLAATAPTLGAHRFAQANTLAPERIAHLVEVARNGLSTVNQHLYG